MYGDIKIERVNDQLFFVFRSQRSLLHHFHYDQFHTDEKGTDTPDYRLEFRINSKGEIDKISTRPLGDPLTDFIKKKNSLFLQRSAAVSGKENHPDAAG